ncbi:MAG: glycogen debranching protein [Myxococcales bacterium]
MSDAIGAMTAPADDYAARWGAPAPLGASWIAAEQAYNFALYSRHAAEVTLLLFTAADRRADVEIPLDPVANRTGRVWHCRMPIARLPDGLTCYGYTVAGHSPPAFGDRFDPEKVLLDPYATAIVWPATYDRQAARRPGSTMGRAPLGALPARDPARFDWGDDAAPRHGTDAIVYEVHVRGFTKRPNSGVAAENRGTFAGLLEKVPYLQDLGVTVLELMPVHQFDPGEKNFWGYMTLSFFAPHHLYCREQAPLSRMDEFRELVKACHSAGIEVVLDVVYNHTSEAGADGPTYCYRGIDNGTYYLLEKSGSYNDDAGTGNVLRTAHPAVRRLIVDSVRHWAREGHVDGFRFDLASIFARRDDGSIDLDSPPVVAEIGAEADLAALRLIAEPWDAAGSLLGRGFPGREWMQWNGDFRDDVRAFVRGDDGRVGGIMARMYGSDDRFPDAEPDVCHPRQSLNFVTCHDGFTLRDLVSYKSKHNPGSEGGTDDNLSSNCGVEGDEGAGPEVMALRKRQAKNFFTLLLVANGTPMIRAGDEFLHTQRGNNNPYNQDNEISWLDWDLAAANADVLRFVKRMIAFRKAHPALRPGLFWRDSVSWHGVSAEPDLGRESHTIAFHVRPARHLPAGSREVYVMINAYSSDLPFGIFAPGGAAWRRAIDTSLPSPQDIAEPGAVLPIVGDIYVVPSRSIAVLVRD